MLFELDLAEREAYELIEKGIGELVFRDEKKRFDRFIKFEVLNSDKIDSKQKDELINQILNMGRKQEYDLKDVRKKMQIADKKLAIGLDSIKDMSVDVDAIAKSMKNVEALAALNVGLELANIAVSVAGFVIIAGKLNKLSAEVHEISSKLDKVADVLKNEKLETCQKLIMKFNAVTDKVKNKEPINVDALQELIIDMRAFISGMVANINDESLETGVSLRIINTLLPAYTLLVCEHLDRYYFAKENVPANYEMFVSLFDELTTKQFIEKMEDYFMLDLGMNNLDMTDAVNTQLLMIINDRTQIDDQLEILKELKTEERVVSYRASIEAAINEYISKIIPNLSEQTGIDEATCKEVLLR